MAERKESVTAAKAARKQSAAGPPTTDMVKVAVLPPRLPGGMAPPTGLGPSDTFSWQESINWQHNEPIESSSAPRKQSFMKKIGLTTERKRRNEDTPVFTFREVTYDTWRKHYAKDAEGNYRGTHAPAEDCLLKPEDVAKWRVEAPKTKGDQWTRGRIALPVYDEIHPKSELPAYRDGTSEGDDVDSMEPGLTAEQVQAASASVPEPMIPRETIADGKTAQQIIEEAKRKHAENPKGQTKGLKGYLQKGAEMAMLGQ